MTKTKVAPFYLGHGVYRLYSERAAGYQVQTKTLTV